MTRRGDERGLLATELAIVLPVMFVFALLAVFMVHVERHSSRAQQAADAAARAASLQRNETDARAAAQQAAELVCHGDVHIDDAGWRFQEPQQGSFTPGRVTVALACVERFDAFGPLLNDQQRTERGIAVAAIEYWRAG